MRRDSSVKHPRAGLLRLVRRPGHSGSAIAVHRSQGSQVALSRKGHLNDSAQCTLIGEPLQERRKLATQNWMELSDVNPR